MQGFLRGGRCGEKVPQCLRRPRDTRSQPAGEDHSGQPVCPADACGRGEPVSGRGFLGPVSAKQGSRAVGLGSCVRRAARGPAFLQSRALAGGARGTAHRGCCPSSSGQALTWEGARGTASILSRGEREVCRERASDEEEKTRLGQVPRRGGGEAGVAEADRRGSRVTVAEETQQAQSPGPRRDGDSWRSSLHAWPEQ